MVPAVIVGIFLVMAIIIAACVVPSDITKILNPEHEAALQLATRFLGKSHDIRNRITARTVARLAIVSKWIRRVG